MSFRRWLFRLHPRRVAQALVVAANGSPLTGIFKALYDLGLRRTVRALSKHPELHAVYGTGSFFDGVPLYGHSDVDLILVFKDHLERGEGVQHQVADTYNRATLLFPFMGQWSEKSANLIFLSEVSQGFPLPASFRVRLKRGQLHLLHGEPVELPAHDQEPTAVELLDELDTLVRVGVLTSERWGAREIFWQGLLKKAVGLARELGLTELADEASATPAMAVTHLDRRSAYFRGANAAELFQTLLDFSGRVHAAYAASQPGVSVDVTFGASGPPVRSEAPPPDYLDRNDVRASWEQASVPLGLHPKLFYISTDETTHLVELDEAKAYKELRILARQLKVRGGHRDSVIALVGPHMLLFSWQGSYVDVIPLNPLVHAPAHAMLNGRDRYSIPEPVWEALQQEADALYGALEGAYTRHTGWLPSRTYPEVYVEDDIDTIRDAWDILRAYFARPPDGIVFTSSRDLVQFLRDKYPNAGRFLDFVEEYDTELRTGTRGVSPANNLYRCLHQFMAQVLGGAETVSIDEPDRKLGITVGITTRNRAPDLVNALESLTHQTRVPDEIVIVDNGSTDNTKEVVDSFQGRLTLTYDYLAEASIPKARNRVLELANHDVVAFTDDDCGIPHGWLGSVERAFLRADNVGLVGGWVAHWPAEVESAVDTYYEIFHGHKT